MPVPASLRRAARHGDGWIGAFVSERKFARLAARIRELLAEEWRSADDFTWGAFLFGHLGPDAAQSRAAGAAYIGRVYHLPGEDVMDRFGIAGPVEACLERVQRYLDTGANYIVFGPVCGYKEWSAQLAGYGELIAKLRRR